MVLTFDKKLYFLFVLFVLDLGTVFITLILIHICMILTILSIKAHVVILFLCLSGGTKDIGSALTRMCMRHRSIEAKLKQFSM